MNFQLAVQANLIFNMIFFFYNVDLLDLGKNGTQKQTHQQGALSDV